MVDILERRTDLAGCSGAPVSRNLFGGVRRTQQSTGYSWRGGGLGPFLSPSGGTSCGGNDPNGELAAARLKEVLATPDNPEISNDPVRQSFSGVNNSSYQKTIPFTYGTDIVEGNAIWASGFRPKTVSDVPYTELDLAVGICEGEIENVLRIWYNDTLIYDKKLLEDGVLRPNAAVQGVGAGVINVIEPESKLYKVGAFVPETTLTIFLGTEDQEPSPLIEAFEGELFTPAHHGLAYMVFQNFATSENNVGKFTAEVVSKGKSFPPKIQVPIIGALASAGFDLDSVILPTLFYSRDRLEYVILGTDITVNPGFNFLFSLVFDSVTLEYKRFNTFPSFIATGVIALFDKAGITDDGRMLYTGATTNGAPPRMFDLFHGGHEESADGVGSLFSAFTYVAVGETTVRDPSDGTEVLTDVFFISTLNALELFAAPKGGISSYKLKSLEAFTPSSGPDQEFVSKAIIYEDGNDLNFFFAQARLALNLGIIKLRKYKYFDGGLGAFSSVNDIVLLDTLDMSAIYSVPIDILGGSILVTTHAQNALVTISFSGQNLNAGQHFAVNYDILTKTVVRFRTTFTQLGHFNNSTSAFGNKGYYQLTPASTIDRLSYSDSTDTYITDLSTLVQNRVMNDHAGLEIIPPFDSGFDGSGSQAGYTLHYDVSTESITSIGNDVNNGDEITIQKVFYAGQERSDVLVKDVVFDLFSRVGITDDQLSYTLNQGLSLHGFTVTATSSVASLVTALQEVFTFDITESGGTINFTERGLGPQPGSDTTDTFMVSSGAGNWFTETLNADIVPVRKQSVTYKDLEKDYGINAQTITLPNIHDDTLDTSAVTKDVRTNVVLTATEARKLSEIKLYSYNIGKTDYSFTLLPQKTLFEPNDVVTLTLSHGYSTPREVTVRLVNVDLDPDFSIKCRAVQEYPEIYSDELQLFGALGKKPVVPPINKYHPVVHINVPYIDETDLSSNTSDFAFLAVLAYDAADDILDQELVRYVDAEGIQTILKTPVNHVSWGIARATVPVSPVTPFFTDTTSQIVVVMEHSPTPPVTVTQAEFLDYTNLAYIGRELIAFRDVTNNADGTITLSHLSRGLYGTDENYVNHLDNERIVFLSDRDAIIRHDLNGTSTRAKGAGGAALLALTNSPQKYEVIETAPRSRTLWIPHNVTAARDATNLTITWDFRARFGGNLVDGTGDVGIVEADDNGILVNTYIVSVQRLPIGLTDTADLLPIVTRLQVLGTETLVLDKAANGILDTDSFLISVQHAESSTPEGDTYHLSAGRTEFINYIDL